jgi:hypothetical protein
MNLTKRFYVFYPLLAAQARGRLYRSLQDPANWTPELAQIALRDNPHAPPEDVHMIVANSVETAFANLNDELAAGWLHRHQTMDRLYIAARRTGQDHPF